jgi:hypothetical protein
MCHRIRRWKEVGFRAKGDFGAGRGQKTPQRLTRNGLRGSKNRKPTRETFATIS